MDGLTTSLKLHFPASLQEHSGFKLSFKRGAVVISHGTGGDGGNLRGWYGRHVEWPKVKDRGSKGSRKKDPEHRGLLKFSLLLRQEGESTMCVLFSISTRDSDCSLCP